MTPAFVHEAPAFQGPAPDDVVLSVVMPCFNERSTVSEISRRVLSTPLKKELLIVDDKSTDGTRDLLLELRARHPEIRLLLQDKNCGKGAAVRRGFVEARGQVVLVQDADLEYDPKDYAALVAPILEGQADVVYGSRFQRRPVRGRRYWHFLANDALTKVGNLLSGLELTDMETCYKVFRREIIQGLVLEEDRFGFDPEVTLKLGAIPGLRILEVPVGYRGRSYAEGKKLGLRDAVRTVYVLGKYGLVQRGRLGTKFEMGERAAKV